MSRHRTAYRRRCSSSSLLLLLFLLLLLPPPFAQGAIQIPDGYKVKNMLQPPLLTEAPKSLTAFSREDVFLPCEATGNPTPTFRWEKNGRPFGSAVSGSGTLRAEGEGPLAEGEEPLALYEGSFRCIASNALGTAVTQSVRVIVEAQPVLLKQHKIRKTATEGDSIVLSCSPPESSTPPHIHWMDKRMVHIRQNERVLVGLDGRLYFSNLLKSDSRDDYTCNAQYAAAKTILPDTAVSLVVAASNAVPGRKPHFFRPLGVHSSVLGVRGHPVTLECLPKGLPTPKMEWKKKDGSLEQTSAELQNHNRWLHFDQIDLNDDGEYECLASNSQGSALHSFSLSVEAAPYWVKEPTSKIYSPGETVLLDCQAEGIPTPKVTWSINGQVITDEKPRLSRSPSGALILRDVGFDDTAVYQCEATNEHGAILINTYLHVVELPPQILSSDGVLYRVIEGNAAMMDCRSFGSPRPHVTWEGEDKRVLLSDRRVSLMTNGTLLLSEVEHRDQGAYTCSIQSNTSITAHLQVFNRTVILTGPQNLRTLRGNDALLSCSFITDQQLLLSQMVWKKNGHKVMESPPDDKFTIFENGSLKVSNVDFKDNAVYSCEVITTLDHVNASGSITVVDRPDPPKDLSLSDVEDHSLTLSWIPGQSHNSPTQEFIVEAREEKHTDPDRWRWAEWRRVPGDFNHLQLRLRPFCTYRFRVLALNDVGSSRPSAESRPHSTPPAVPDRNPSGVRSESADPQTLVVMWDEMDQRFHNGHDFLYKVSWREADGTSVQWSSADVQAPPFVVNDTGTFTPFEVKVQAVNSLGPGPEPEPEIGHSGEDKPADPPGGVGVTVRNLTARVTWNEAQNVRGRLLGYKIYIRRLGPRTGRGRRSLHRQDHRSEAGKERDQDSWVVEVDNQKTSEEVTPLKLYSRYELSVTAFNSKGEGPHSPTLHFSTPEGAPGPPASLRFESPSEKSLILYWTPPLEPNGVLLGYMVQYQQEVESRDSPVQMEIISDPSVIHIQLDSLDPSSHYIFKVIARTAAGDGVPIMQRGATLLEGVPPSNVTIVSGNTFLNLSWIPGERDRNHGFHFLFRRKSVGSRWEESETVNSTQGFYSLTGLQPGSQYRLRVLYGNESHWEDEAWTMGPVPSEMPGAFAAQGWLIGLISAIVLLVLILLILCLIKRSKGGKYAVKDKEEKEVDSDARPMKDETFGEYRSLDSDGDEKRSDSQPSLCGDSKLGSEDSLAEYGDSVDIQFNEDGSFIGQYSGRGPVPPGNESSSPASPTNVVPPPPIAPSMSSILNRPS